MILKHYNTMKIVKNNENFYAKKFRIYNRDEKRIIL